MDVRATAVDGYLRLELRTMKPNIGTRTLSTAKLARVALVALLVCVPLDVNAIGFAEPITLEIGSAPSSMVSGTLSDGGNHFLALTSPGVHDLQVFVADATGTFSGPTGFASTAGPQGALIGDFNGDGHNDVVVTTDPYIALHVGDGTGQFPQNGGVFNGFTGGISPVAGDVDNDGDDDVVVSFGIAGAVSVVIADGLGGLSRFGNFSAGGGYIPSIATGDFDRDGNVDLLAANAYSGFVTILWGDGLGTYFTGATLSVGNFSNCPSGFNCNSPRAVAVGDFNDDGNLDIATANRGNGNVTILLGDEGRDFSDPAMFPVGSSPTAIAIADFDDDSNPDIAVANTASGTVSILAGDGEGAFQLPVDIDVGADPISIALGDFNQDGATDIAVANAASHDVSILLNLWVDTDGDTILDAEDNCPEAANLNQSDFDGDTQGDVCDPDDDDDGALDSEDAFPFDPTETLDTDEDGTGNNADPDDDNDGLTDEAETNTYGTNPLRRDTDRDGLDDGEEIELGLDPLNPDDCPDELCPPAGNVLLRLLPVLEQSRDSLPPETP